MENKKSCFEVLLNLIFGFVIGILTVYALIIAASAVIILVFLGIVINALIN